MTLSETLLPYEKNTLILVCDRSQAKFFRAVDREFTEIDVMENERLALEGEHPPGGEHMSVLRDEEYHEHEAGVFYKKLAERLFDLKKELSYENLILVVPADDKNTLAEALHEEVHQALDITIPKQLLYLENDALAERIDEHRRG